MTQESPQSLNSVGGPHQSDGVDRAQQHGREDYQITGCCL
jgi:hypothetical protein